MPKNVYANKADTRRAQREKIEQEHLVETIEGMAEYEACAISPQLYYKRLDGYLRCLCAVDEQFFNIQRMGYFSGCVCPVMDELGMDFSHQPGSERTCLFPVVCVGNPAEPKIK